MNVDFLSWKEFVKVQCPTQLNVCNFLLNWIKKYDYDFCDSDGLQRIQLLENFIDEYVIEDYVQIAKQIRKSLIKLKSTEVEKSTVKAEFVESWSNGMILQFPPDVLAEQLTLIENDIFATINPSQVLQQAWTKKNAEQKAPGIIALSKRFNDVANWFVELILEMPTPKSRAERISKVIDIGSVYISNKALLKHHNYSTLMTVIAALNKAPITRLKASFLEVSSKQLQVKCIN